MNGQMERIEQFGRNVWDLWQTSNNDQRIFLAALVGVAGVLLVLTFYAAVWRFKNRHELRKMWHYAAMRHYIKREEPVGGKNDPSVSIS